MAPLKTTLGSLMVNESLPEPLRDYGRVMDGKAMREVLQTVATQYPGDYRHVSKKLSDVGREISHSTGGYSFGLKHLKESPIFLQTKQRLDAEIEHILDSDMDEDLKHEKITLLVGKEQKSLTEAVYKEALESKNPLALQVLSGARGKPMNLNSLIGADMLYQDNKGNIIPFPVLNGYGKGLSPAEYFGSAFGARKGLWDVKKSTADAGFFSKQLIQASHRLMITKHDADGDPLHEMRGLPVDTDDADNEGSLLSIEAGGYPRNTPLTPRVLKDLRDKGIHRILARSPIVGGPPEGGLYARDVGIRERGGVSPVGDQIGIAAAQALCLAGGTEVRMADGSSRAIELIRAGDIVLGCSETGTVRPVRVLASVSSGMKSCVKAVFRRGTGSVSDENMLTIVATTEHKLLSEIVIRSGRKNNKHFHPVSIRAIGTSPGPHDKFCARLAERFDDGNMPDEPTALLFGLMIGDGCYTGGITNGVSFSCYDPSLIEDTKNYLSELGFQMRCTSTPGEYRLKDLTHTEMKTSSGGLKYRHRFMQKLKDWGVWGQGSGTKVLPTEVFSWSNRSVADLISGFVATDGFVRTANKSPMIGFSSNSKILLQQIKLLLQLRFGVQTTTIFASKKKKPGGGSYAPNYRFGVNGAAGILRLASVLRIPGVKGPRLSLLSNSSRQGNEQRRCPRVSIAEVGELQTYDIYVEHPDHLFILANGLVVSNSEPITQGGLSSKHSGGVAGAARTVSGFKLLNQLVQTPKAFTGGAAHADIDGRVQSINPAPAGGHYVTVGSQQHFVAPGFDLKVKLGDEVEAGDVLSEGIPNPAKVVEHKGIGEGRRYFVHAFREALKDSGISAHRRNIEVVARGLINHVRLTEEMGPHVPGDIVSYDQMEHSWEPREDAKKVSPKSAVGKYLEVPVLHHSVGTKIRPSMLKDFEDFGIKSLHVHDEEPPFEPEMVRGMENLSHDPDWMVRMLGSNIQKNLLAGVRRGDVSDPTGTSYVPSLADPLTFGRRGLVKSPKVEPAPKAVFKPSSVLDV